MNNLNKIKTKITDFFIRKTQQIQIDNEQDNSSQSDSDMESFNNNEKFENMVTTLLQCQLNQIQPIKLFEVSEQNIKELEVKLFEKRIKNSQEIRLQDPRDNVLENIDDNNQQGCLSKKDILRSILKVLIMQYRALNANTSSQQKLKLYLQNLEKTKQDQSIELTKEITSYLNQIVSQNLKNEGQNPAKSKLSRQKLRQL